MTLARDVDNVYVAPLQRIGNRLIKERRTLRSAQHQHGRRTGDAGNFRRSTQFRANRLTSSHNFSFGHEFRGGSKDARKLRRLSGEDSVRARRIAVRRVQNVRNLQIARGGDDRARAVASSRKDDIGSIVTEISSDGYSCALKLEQCA